jgi:hypothetical protein
VILRISKVFLVACVALFALLVGVDNIFDYQPNFQAVRHILSMDTVPSDSTLLWRAITSETLHHAAYWLIIAAEIISGLICARGAFRPLLPWFHDRRRRMVSDVAIGGMERAGSRLSLHRLHRPHPSFRAPAGRRSRMTNRVAYLAPSRII